MANRILVTGGAGFIGANIAASLGVARIFDDFSGTNLVDDEYFATKGIEISKGGINNPKQLREALNGIDTVYHQAALSSVPASIKDPLRTDSINSQGTLLLLKECIDSGVKNIIFASSSAIYGNNPKNPKREDMRPSPESPYAASKLASEHYCRVFSELYGIKAASLRYFNVYGPGQKAGSDYAAVIPQFIELAISGKPLVIYGDGTQTRDFVFVSDVVEANKNAEGRTGIYNIGSGTAISIKELAEMIIGITGSKSEIKYEGKREGEVIHSTADISLAKKELGWGPKYDLQSGLKEYIDYYLGSTKR